ncbi:chemotaxis protein CheR [Pseudomonas sp. R1-18]|uniref:CheR family methyltransferase n=1 Tax=Pseudomonas sp. R1-18 TaxID=1632772 RepID=UPI003DA99057
MNDDSRFFGFLKERIGLDVASVGEAIVERAVRQRRSASGAVDSDAYWQLLVGSTTEQQALIEAVIVPETWFFRYPESFATLGKLAAARLAALGNARPLRVLSLPCSTGEEPYSIVMALFDTQLSAQQFTVDAIDISPLSIGRAQRGLYGKNSFRGHDLSFRDRYFTSAGQGFQIADRVRERVNFQPGNLLDPALASRAAYDFVFCRNLVIYFDQPTQKHVFEVLKRLTHQDGVLFIGPAEGSLLASIGMHSIGIAQSFAFRHAPLDKPAMKSTSVRFAAPTALNSSRIPVSRPAPAPLRPVPRQAPHSVAPASGKESTVALLSNIASLANQGRTADARAECERYLRDQAPVAAVFYWLGLLSEVEGNASEAQGFYRKALYLEPQHAESLAQLAALLAARGDAAGARRLQDRAARGADKQGGHR